MDDSCAVVVGVEKYWCEDACLVGPARDATRFARWLTDQGGADRKNVHVLISAMNDADLDPDFHDGEATQDAIITAVRNLRRQAEEENLRRAYFYFSGHGVQDLDGPLEPVILPADFSEDLRHKSTALLAVARFLQLTGIPEQIVISDACRDFPFAETMLLRPHRDPFGVDIERLPGGQESPFQMLLSAATPGGTARTVPGARGRESAFTSELLRALEEPGPAMRWDLLHNRYVVAADGLLSHLDAAIRPRVRADPFYDRSASPSHCYAQQINPPASGTPVLATFRPDQVAPVPLGVSLEPAMVARCHPEVGLSLDGLHDVLRQPARLEAGGPTARFEVMPRIYVATATADSYRQERDRYAWEVYADRDESIQMIRADGGGDERPRFRPDCPDVSINRVPGAVPGLTVRGEYQENLVELRAEDGRPVAIGRNGVTIPPPVPTAYRVRTVSPFFRPAEQREWLFVARPDEHQVVRIPDDYRQARDGDPFSSGIRSEWGFHQRRNRTGIFVSTEPAAQISHVGGTAPEFRPVDRNRWESSPAEWIDTRAPAGRRPIRITLPAGVRMDITVPVLNDGMTGVRVLFSGRGGYSTTFYFSPDDDGVLGPDAAAQELLATGDHRTAVAAVANRRSLVARLVRVIAQHPVADDLDELSENAVFRSDALVFAAVGRESESLGAARRLLLEACDAGMPLTTEALRLMHDRGRDWQIAHPLMADAARHLVNQAFGTMWVSTWNGVPDPDPIPAEPLPKSPWPTGDVKSAGRTPASRAGP